jgi:hypothetical protein
MTPPARSYHDLSDIYARKQAARRQAARLSFGEKIAIVEAMRERLAPLKQAREARQQQKIAGNPTTRIPS